MTRVCGPILIKSGPAPAPRPRRGKTTAMTPVYEAVRTLKPGNHFEVPNSRGLDQTQARASSRRCRTVAATGRVRCVRSPASLACRRRT